MEAEASTGEGGHPAPSLPSLHTPLRGASRLIYAEAKVAGLTRGLAVGAGDPAGDHLLMGSLVGPGRLWTPSSSGAAPGCWGPSLLPITGLKGPRPLRPQMNKELMGRGSGTKLHPPGTQPLRGAPPPLPPDTGLPCSRSSRSARTLGGRAPVPAPWPSRCSRPWARSWPASSRVTLRCRASRCVSCRPSPPCSAPHTAVPW